MKSSINFYYSTVMKNLFINSPTTPKSGQGVTFSGIGSMGDFWDVLEGPIMDAIYMEKWYNNETVDIDHAGAIYYQNKVLGYPRLRQVRVKRNTCKVNPKLQRLIENCYEAYSSETESKEPFGIYETNHTIMEEPAFFYQTAEGLGSSTETGQRATYNGGGYIQDLAHYKQDSLDIIEGLKTRLWIDRGTRAVLLDLTVYNGNVNLFCQIKLMVEFPETGGAVTSSVIRTVKLIRYVSIMDYFVLACEILFGFFVTYYLIEEFIEIRKQKCAYFTASFWNLLDFLVPVLAFVCIAFNAYREYIVRTTLERILADQNHYISFEFLCFWQEQFNNAIALIVFFSWVKIFKYLSFNKTMNQLGSTISASAKDIAGFMVLYTIVFFAFAQFGYLLFGSQVADYSSISETLFTLFRTILGDFDFPTLQNASPIIGPIYFISYVFFVFFVLFNMFIAIINDSYSVVKEDLDQDPQELNFGSFFKVGFGKFLDKLNIKRDRAEDIKAALNNGDLNNDSKLDYSEISDELKKRGYSDEEIRAFFNKYDKNGDLVLSRQEQNEVFTDMNKLREIIDSEMEKLKVEEELAKELEAKRKANLVSFKEFRILNDRVDQMENSIGNIIAKIDSVLNKFEQTEKAKFMRREAMSKIMDTYNEAMQTGDETKKYEFERLIRLELKKFLNEPQAPSVNSKRSSSSAKTVETTTTLVPATTESNE